MSNMYSIRLTFDRGFEVSAAKTFVATCGAVTVGESRDARFHRVVRTATFTPMPGQDPLPPLRDVELLHLTNGFVILTGKEEVVDNDLGRGRMVAQTWQMTPAPFDELLRIEGQFGRLVKRLRELGVDVHMQPGGAMSIAGETPEED